MTKEEFMEKFINEIEHNKKYTSHRDLSFLINKSENYINVMKNKKSLPNMSTFLDICKALSINISHFFKTTDDNISKDYLLLEKIKNLSKDEFQAIELIVDKLVQK